jgi:hypothetical protein
VIESNAINQQQVANMSAHFMELHIKVVKAFNY